MKTELTPKSWRDQVVEEALEPDLPIIDAHHHTWDVPPAPIFETYGMEALFADKVNCGHNIVATVPVDCHAHYRTSGPEHLRIVGETEYMHSIATEGSRRGGRYAGTCAAIVSGADLLDWARVGETLDAHIAASPRFRGIRYKTAFDSSLEPNQGCEEPNVMTRPELRKGLAEVVKRDLSLDAWLLQTQLPEIDALARDVPEARIILNHLGGPFVTGRYLNRTQESISDWKRSLKSVARHHNIFLKIGALNMAHTGVSAIGKPRPFTSEEVAARQRDYILTAIDFFGPSRCMFESNFPVDMLSISYGVLWNVFKRVSAGFSARERADLFAGTATRAYRIVI